MEICPFLQLPEHCHNLIRVFTPCFEIHLRIRERSGSVVECMTWDRRAAGSSLTSVTALHPWVRHYSLFSTDSTQEDPFRHNWKIVDWYVKNKKKYRRSHCVVSLSKTLSAACSRSTGSTQKDPSWHDWKNWWLGRKESEQMKEICPFLQLPVHCHTLIRVFTPCFEIHLRIEMQIFSLHWMMQNIRLFNVCEAHWLLRDIKKLMFCIIQCKPKKLHFNLYIYILNYQSNILNYLPPKSAGYPWKKQFFCNGGVGTASEWKACT